MVLRSVSLNLTLLILQLKKNYCPAEFTMLVLKIGDFPLITVKIIMS
jgi:hypothetical protein